MPKDNITDPNSALLLGGEPKNEPLIDPKNSSEKVKDPTQAEVMQGMLDQMKTMTEEKKPDSDKGVQPLPTLEDLINKHTPEIKESGTKAEQKTKFDFDDSTADEIVQHIFSEVQDKMINPLHQQINGLQLKVEVADCKIKHSDFDSYIDDIFKIGRATPNISVEQAYVLARSNNPEKGKKGESNKDPKNVDEVTEKLEKVLDITKKAVITPISEKGGISNPTVTSKPRTDMRGAAEDAFDTIVGEQNT